jgi:uncharacterized membrane protein
VRFATFTGLCTALIWAPLGIWLGWDVLPTWGSVEWAFVVVSGILHVLYAMKAAPLSHVAPAREVSMLIAALIGGQLLGERDRLARIAGAALVAIGVMALALG